MSKGKKTIRLDKYLAGLGYGSRKDVGKGLRRGYFIWNDEKIEDASLQVDPRTITAENATYQNLPMEPASPLCLILHKPEGYVSSHVDDGGESLFHLLPHQYCMRTPELQIAGRLDKDTTGMIVLVDDGQLVHKIISPKNHVAKTYEVTLAKPLSGQEKDLFENGTLILPGETKPLKPAQLVPHKDDVHRATLTIQEGKYHQVRRMFEVTENEVTQLHRSAIGDITLDDISEGEFKIVSQEDILCLISKA